MIPVLSRPAIRRRAVVAASASYSSVVLADTPAGYWRLGEASGTNAADSSGFGRDGTYTGTVTLGTAGAIAGDSDKAATFGGGYVNIAGFGGNITDDVTLEAWVYPTSNSGTQLFISLGDDTAGNSSASLRTSSGTPIFYVIVGGSAYPVSASGPLTLNQWSHVVGTRSGAAMALYVNGVMTTASAVTGSLRYAVGNDSQIGTQRPYAGIGWVGAIDETAMYAAALSQTRVLAHYNAGI